MKLKIVSKEHNPLLKRIEVCFKVEHDEAGGTPTRAEVKMELASQLKTQAELVYIKRMETKTGTLVAVGEANVYDNAEQAKLLEPKYIIARNKLPEKPEPTEEAEASPDESSEEQTEEQEES